MTWESTDERRRRSRDRLLAGCVIATIVWTTLAFGAVYRWAYIPLLVSSAAIGLACLIPRRGGVPRLTNSAPLWLALVGAGALLQLVPLPATILARLSPATQAFLKSHEFSYALATAGTETAEQLWHPLSLAPDATWLALTFLATLTLLLAGLMRWLTATRVRTIVRALITLGMVVAVVGIAQKSLGAHHLSEVRIYGVWKPQYVGDAFGPFVNRNHFAGWIVMVLPLALAYLAAILTEGLSEIGPGWRNRILWLGSERAGRAATAGFVVMVMVVALVYSGSRSGVACALFVVAAIGWLAVRASISRTIRIVVSATFALLLASALFWAGSDILFHRFTLVPAEIGDRLGTWRDATRIIHDFPVAGVGLNAYGTASLQYQTVESAWHFDAAHNDYLQLAAEGGVLLTLPALLALVALVRDMRRRARQQADAALGRWLRAGARVGLAAIALQSLVDFSLQIPANAALFTVIAAIAVHSPRTAAVGSAGRATAARLSRSEVCAT